MSGHSATPITISLTLRVLWHAEDPEAWGYHALSGRTAFVPDYRSADPPFELALVGSGSLVVPEELAYMVSVYRGLDYLDFYRLIASTDIVVPAFADNGCKLISIYAWLNS